MVLPPLLATIFCWYVSPNEITTSQAFLALLLLMVPWFSYLLWRSERRREIPLFAMMAMMHWVYFAQPLFWGDRRIPGMTGEPPQDLITAALAMVVLGVACLWLGMRTHVELWSPSRVPDLTDSHMSWPYLRLLMLGGILVGFWSSGAYALGEGGRQAIVVIQTVLPATVFAFFFRKYIRGAALSVDKALVFAFLASRVLVGLSSGWLGTVIWPGIICVLIYVAEGRRVPLVTAGVVLGCVLFLQVGKEAFRGEYWGGQAEGTMTERIQFWIDQSASKWSEAMNGGGGNAPRALASQTVSRLSLLTQAAHVLDWTPEKVPFQYGNTYSYMAITFIPRFFWPQKPSMSEANKFYQVAYGLTAEGDLNKVSIAVGFLTEGYINFGWWGVVGISYIVGVILGIFQRTLLHAESGMLFGSLGVALIPGLLGLESQMAQYFSGVVQQTGLTFLILLPIIKPRATLPLGYESSAPPDFLQHSQT